MTYILKKDALPKLKVREVPLEARTSPLLGMGIDVMNLPEGHLVCPKCKGHRFEAWLYGDAHRLEMGCIDCNENYRLLFPLDVSMPPPYQGRFTCKRHPKKAMVLIHNIDTISVGCESCYTQILFQLRNKSGLIVPEDIN